HEFAAGSVGQSSNRTAGGHGDRALGRSSTSQSAGRERPAARWQLHWPEPAIRSSCWSGRASRPCGQEKACRRECEGHWWRLGFGEEFVGGGHLSAAGNHAFWGEGTGHYKDFLFNPYGNGWHIDRTQFDTMLQRSAHTTGATIHRGVKRIRVEREASRWSLM